MNKKSQGLNLTPIIVAAVALILLFIMIMIFTGRISLDKFKEPYDPDKHVCLESCGDFIMNHFISKLNCNEPEVRKFIRECNYFDHSWEGGCLDYHQKTFCEKCTDTWTWECDEKCRCDEWETEKCITYINYNITYTNYAPHLKKDNQTSPDFLYKHHTCYHDISEIGELKNIYGFIEVNKIGYKTFRIDNCLSAHSLSPCELGDEKYILDCDTKGGCRNETTLHAWDKSCNLSNCPKKQCRLKTIHDYSCKELLYHILKKDSYCSDGDMWENVICRSKWVTTPEIVDIYKEKGCLE